MIINEGLNLTQIQWPPLKFGQISIFYFEIGQNQNMDNIEDVKLILKVWLFKNLDKIRILAIFKGTD